MLELTDVHTYYGESHILQGVSLKVEKENIMALVGRNGVGKTTTLHSVVGFCIPREGQIFFEGKNLVGLPTHQIIRFGISLVPQGRRLFPSLTVREHLEISSRRVQGGKGWDCGRIFQLFPALEERQNRMGNMLSGGERQMVAIARALVANPVLLLMDEPSEGLAPIVAQEVFRVTQELKKSGLAILVVEQNIRATLEIADYIYVMNKGMVVFQSPPDVLREDREMTSKYLGV
jgi:branched-chain amino acid transport system ATP-binding protein